MVSRGDDVWVLYPVYFDRSVSRKKGRRVAVNLAVEKPRVDEIERVLQKADISCAVEKKTHPSYWFSSQGRILVSKTSSKEKLIKSVARGIKQGRKQ
mgnify:CR=1 FL=1